MWIQYGPWFVAMVGLGLASAFCSASEAALFYLNRQDRRRLAAGSRAQKAAVALLADADRLLTTILFWNLVANLTLFAIASIVGIRLQEDGHAAAAGSLAAGSLLAVIIFCETLPKSLATLAPRQVAGLVALPLAAMARLLDPVLPAFRLANLLSRRLLWPSFQAEPYLELSDLERAVRLSTSSAALLAQEEAVLQGIVSLSAIRADELMRPRNRLLIYRAPVSRGNLGGQLPLSGYLLIAEGESDEVVAAVHLADLGEVPERHLERLASPVLYVPWCTSVAETWERLERESRRVAAVVNEYGETIGVLTREDVLDTIFSPSSSRSERLLKRTPIRQAGSGVWQVTGMTGVRRLRRHFQRDLPPTQSVTLAGVLHEALERLPAVGDECRWGPFHLRVIEAPERGQLLVELTLVEEPAP